jgi:hypothetical protein
LQVLDGPESAVHRLYATIREDPRDASAETPLPPSAAERTFPNWEMGLERPSASVNSCRPSPFLPSGELLPAAEPIPDVFEPLQRFRHSTAQEQNRLPCSAPNIDDSSTARSVWAHFLQIDTAHSAHEFSLQSDAS